MYREQQTTPHGSDEAHGNLVAAIANFLRPQFYLELGCFRGETFRKVEPYCERAVALDIEPGYKPFLEAHGLGEMFVCEDSVSYLSKLDDGSIDLCFLDSSHREENTVREFLELAPKMRRNGILLMHDSYPPNEEFATDGKCGGVWRAVERIREDREFEFMTFPSQYGLTAARKSIGKQLLWK